VLTPNQTNQLNLTCQVIQQINKLAALNVSDYSISKQTQLEAMQIIGAQVKENTCDWVSNQCKLVNDVASAILSYC
jgi:phage-related protein